MPTTVTLGKLRSSLQKLTLDTVRDLTADIILADDTIIQRKKDEFKAGVNPDGSDIGEYKSESYRLFKIERNPFGRGKVDLKLTGAVESGLEVVYVGDGKYLFKSSDAKWASLVEKYGDQIQLIKKSEFERYQRTVYAPQLNKAMRRLAGL